MEKNPIMKYTIVLLVLTSLCSKVFCQNFEGEIIYQNNIESRIQGVTDAQLTSVVGSRQEYYIKDGHYKSVMNGQSIIMQLYDWTTNRIYNKMAKSDTLYWFNAATNTDDIISHEIKRNAETILGINCDALILKTKYGATTFYFGDNYKLDTNKFLNHEYGNWAFFVKNAGALPLKMVIESDKFKMISTAIEIKPMKLEGNFFSIAPEVPIKQSGK